MKIYNRELSEISDNLDIGTIKQLISDNAEHMLDGLMTGNNDKVEYYNELSGDKNTQKQICNRIIRKIKDWLNLAS